MSMGALHFSIGLKPSNQSNVLSVEVQQDEYRFSNSAKNLLIANFATQKARFLPQIA
jgi:hypothetical protein